jgi:2,4-dienoyl-CoA reductase-like NADH-dependent reductase (Old Yellow Enzyme family)
VTDYSPLFAPLTIGPLTLRNRVAMAPMTRQSAPGGVPTPEMRSYYRRRADGGTGLIITEGIAPNLAGLFGANVPRLFDSASQAGWKLVVDAIHAGGAAVLAQIWHVGAFEPSLIGMRDTVKGIERLSPSGLAAPTYSLGSAMDSSAIDSTIDAYANAAYAAKTVGFDGVEIHGAHGYLPDQFLWTATNQRTDRYGGSHDNRSRFAAEIVAECRQRCGPDFVISFRFSQWKQLDYAARIAETPDALEALLRPVVDAGANLLHASTRRFWEPAFDGSPRSLAAWTRYLTGTPVIAVGAVTLGNDFKSERGKTTAPVELAQLEQLAEALGEGDFDLIAIGRALLANPDWVEIVSSGRLARLQPFSKAMLSSLY